MKVVICAGPPTSGKTTVLKQLIKKLIVKGHRPAFLKIDVQFAEEDELFAKEFNIPTKKTYSGELCPDHCNVMVLGDAIEWAQRENADYFIVETAGLCLRCSPYVESTLGIVVLESTSGMNLPRKIGPMLSLADIAVITKIDLVSQAEREVFRSRVLEAARNIDIAEADALHGIGLDSLIKKILNIQDIAPPLFLRGNPPVGTCTICVGKKEIGWKQHFGVVRSLETDLFYQGE
ncbi:MAG: cobalamin biosynthesis protein [Phycisphaerae bacterium]|jgi:Ni2+-binding GTPase involved in maturation of urease and hydrogenase|nr:cobalamin biosynthesis protein [Phycisphaerae bacterium]